ncbi:FAD dependent oxidoreductase-domain-containing protein [Durotheca rogersii]|uniref:FAD dependent oxidoreductase-domain-containing protein n=1 Tax=Durotheca rogersii TaxID=419775 RepID=UPI002220C1A0|nr:FAD dependent oxidoreductase-domain-containing protein [Durotheca rogersii]KAI5864075.1 FAD dependent oxidoreductase-domain-containing protein [Durotheca rogersii]
MGAVQSSTKTFWLAVKAFGELNAEFRALLRRASQAPGLPVPNPSPSYWLEDPPFPDLVDTLSPALPEAADIVIIGSGITGAAVARTVLRESARRRGRAAASPIPRVVVLEARALCSGATGRNGGQIKSAPHEAFAAFRATLGPARAAALTRFQLAHLPLLTDLCRARGWAPAECREVETVDLYLSDEDRDAAFASVEELRKWVPEIEIKTWDGAGAQEVNRHVKGAISYVAGALWASRFVSCVWEELLARFEKHLSIETHTPALAVRTAGRDAAFAYEVVTGRGVVRCDHVVHATNAFAPQLVAGLRGKLTGVLDTMSAQRPGADFPALGGARSWTVVYDGAFDYVTQRPAPPAAAPAGAGSPPQGDIMIGGGFARAREECAAMVGVWDDGRVDAPPVAQISGIFPTLFAPRWGAPAPGSRRARRAWTGVLGVTGDRRPFVGRLDAELTGRSPPRGSNRDDAAAATGVRPGEWIAAGYCGDGMVWAWLSGTALGVMLAGAEDDDAPPEPGRPGGALADWFPRDLEPTPRRLRRAGLEALAHRFF